MVIISKGRVQFDMMTADDHSLSLCLCRFYDDQYSALKYLVAEPPNKSAQLGVLENLIKLDDVPEISPSWRGSLTAIAMGLELAPKELKYH